MDKDIKQWDDFVGMNELQPQGKRH